MIKHDPQITELEYGNLVKTLSESKNITVEEARKEIQQASFQEYLSLLENITPPSGNTIGPGSTSTSTSSVTQSPNKMPKVPTPPNPNKSNNPNWEGGDSPLEIGMNVSMKDATGKPVQATVSKVDKMANGVKIKNPATGKEEWANMSMLEPVSVATEDADLVRLKELAGIKESSSAGATGAGAIAIAPTAMGSVHRRTTTESPKKEYTPKAPPKTIVGDTKPSQASGELSATLAANGKKTASRTNNGFKK